MKIFVALCGLFALTSAEIASSNKHHSQHEQSVSAAKQSLQERLAALEGQTGYNQARYGNAYGTSGSEKYVVGCSACIGSENREAYSSSRQSSASERRSSALNQGLSDSDYAGVGIVGFTNDADDNVQSLVAPNYAASASERASSRYSSSSNAYEADDMQQRVVPGDLSSVSSSAYRSAASEHDEDELQRTLVPVGTSSRIYSQSRGSTAAESSRVGASAVPVYVSSGSSNLHRASSASQSESELSESRKPIPTGQYVSISARPGTANVIAVPGGVIHTSGVPDDSQKYYSRASDYTSGSEAQSTRLLNPTSTTYRVTYNPTRNYVSSDKIASSQSESESSRVGSVQQPDKFVNYNSFGGPEAASQTRYRADESDSYNEQTQTRVVPSSVSYPSNGGSSRYQSSGSSSGYQGQTQARIAPVYPVNTVESASSSLRTADEREQRRYTPAVPTYVSASRISSSDQEESRKQQSSSQYGNAAGSYYVVPVVGQSRSQTQQQQYQRNFSPYVPARTQSSLAGSQQASSDLVSQRFGSVASLGQTDDLHTYMSESERLARLQQQQIAGTASNVAVSNIEANRRTLNTASNLDSAAANFVRSSNLANRNSELDASNVDTSGSGGFNRVRSWNKQSKWSSGSEYGADGKPKSYSTLSTGEGEKYNINGAETGYKAATTTLENDGKVSTYSIHTP